MATENPRVWFKSISLENVRSFGTKQTINFTDKDGNAARWNVILGDNGTGKTTVLKSLCLLTNDSQIPLSYFDRNRTWNFRIGIIKSAEDQWQELVMRLNNDPHRDGSRLSLRSHLGIRQGDLITENPLVFAYGAVRRLGNGAITVEKTNTVQNLFDESTALTNAEELLVQADYLALKEADDFRENNYIRIKNILLNLFRNEISDIQIKAGVTYRHSPPRVFFRTNYGEVSLHELSLGYKTLIAWMVDFAKGLLDRYPDSENPLAEPAVCLVDEIDLHLHPKFQRNIIKFLTETFPNTQFIVTAHSPLIVVAAEEQPQDTNIILLKREGDQTVVVNDPVDVSKWSVDQILNSDLFGHVPSRSEPLTELRTERDTLLSKQALTATQKARLDELDEKIGFVPVGRDQAEIQAETIIQQLADILRSKQQSQ
jgi:predicted ATP-dependent endonuclease of OLD family